MPMPIEIRELHIRVAVNAPPAKGAPTTQNQPAAKGAGGDQDAIVAECVEQVLNIMQMRKER
jgi:hypothetical protein